MNQNVYVTDFQIIEPPYFLTQQESFDWLEKAYASANYPADKFQKLLNRVACPPSQISKRGHYLADFQSKAIEKIIFKLGDKDFAEALTSRMNFFDHSMSQVFKETYDTRALPEQLIHVTCSGYVSPSPAQRTFAKIAPDTTITHCYHMGCYASVPALRMGSGFLNASQKTETCDIFHTELCSLHFHTDQLSPEQLVIQSLFADGTVVYRLVKNKPSQKSFQLLFAEEKMIPNSIDHMAWSVAENGFGMTLSKSVPAAVNNYLASQFTAWAQTWNYQGNLHKDAIWAVHPGGPKIIDTIKDTFSLSEDQVKYSRKVLFERGNMSSATLPHIWNEILADKTLITGKPVISLAFGPGLTVAASLMQVV